METRRRKQAFQALIYDSEPTPTENESATDDSAQNAAESESAAANEESREKVIASLLATVRIALIVTYQNSYKLLVFISI